MNLYLRWIDELEENEKQKTAFQRTDSTVVIAGPGSGKTRVLALKVAQLLREEIDPPRGIACLTYTRMMAKELERRLYSLGILDRPNIFVGTIHGFSLGQVVLPFKEIFDTGLPEVIRIAPQSIQDACFDEAMKEVFGDDYDPENNWDIKGAFVKCRRQRADIPFNQWKDHQDIGLAIQIYEQHLLDSQYVDFDMIIHTALRLIIDQDIVRKNLYARFPWFTVDEYQDLGYPLYRIVTEMVNQTPMKLFAIGDPDQSIFDFAGTDPKYLIELSERPDMQPKIELETNYRSKQEIIEIAQTLLGGSRENCSDEVGGQCLVIECSRGILHQAKMAVRLVKRYQQMGIQNKEIAVIDPWRGKGIERIAEVFAHQHIDFVLDKHPLYDRGKELVKWLEDLGYWCLRGWKEQTSERYNFDDLLAVWQQIGYSPKLVLDKETNNARIHLAKILWNLRNSDQLLHDWLAEVIESLDLETSLEQYKDTYPDEVEEFHNLFRLTSPDNELEDLTLRKFVNLNPSVQLTTLHSSKGTEFQVVIITGVERIRHTSNGKRLLYVGATRAKQVLCLLYTKTCPRWCRSSVVPSYIRRLKAKAKEESWRFVTWERY